MKWGSSEKHPTYHFNCALCSHRWIALTEISSCPGCNIQYRPMRYSNGPSQIVAGGTQTEQLGFGRIMFTPNSEGR